MRVAIVLLFALAVTSISAHAQQRTHTAQGVITFQPKLAIGSDAPPLYEPRPRVTARLAWQAQPVEPRTAGRSEETEIICGMTVVRKRHDLDSKIVLKPKLNPNAAVRKITPPVCTAPK
jgi:hypothetical protein